MLRSSFGQRRPSFAPSFAFAACLTLAAPIRAQQPTAAQTAVLLGAVTGPSGTAISGAFVEITGAKASAHRSLKTDATGHFETAGLPAATYAVRVQFPGFKTMVRDGIALAAGQTLAIDLRLEIAAMGGVQVEASGSIPIGRGTWDLGAFLGGGTGAGKSSNTQFLFAGGRAGRVLTPDLGRTFLRGNFEYAVEVMPVYTVFTPNGAVYGASIKPIILRWNFTSNRHVIPYFHFAGGVLFTTSDVPPPNTSSINFTPQLGGGIHWFVRPERSIDFGVDLVHHSNASLGDHNPGYNASIFFSVGYSWYKHRR